MAVADVIFQDLFISYAIPVFVIFLLVFSLKPRVRRYVDRLRSKLAIRAANVYSDGTCRRKQMLFTGLQRMADGVRGPLKLLELKVGFGNNFRFYPGGCDVVCLDPDPFYEDYIQNIACYDYPQIRILDFVVGGGEVLSGVPDCSLDVVVSIHALCSDPDPLKTVKEIYRILKRGGRLYFLDHTEAPRCSLLGVVRLLVGPFYSLLRMPCPFRNDILKIVRSCPFSQSTSETFRLDMTASCLIDRLLVPAWLRLHASGAATK